jgi:hypothetical protein
VRRFAAARDSFVSERWLGLKKSRELSFPNLGMVLIH